MFFYQHLQLPCLKVALLYALLHDHHCQQGIFKKGRACMWYDQRKAYFNKFTASPR